MPFYNVLVSVDQLRSYEVQAEDAGHAEQIIREDFTLIPHDVVSTDILTLNAEETSE